MADPATPEHTADPVPPPPPAGEDPRWAEHDRRLREVEGHGPRLDGLEKAQTETRSLVDRHHAYIEQLEAELAAAEQELGQAQQQQAAATTPAAAAKAQHAVAQAQSAVDDATVKLATAPPEPHPKRKSMWAHAFRTAR